MKAKTKQKTKIQSKGAKGNGSPNMFIKKCSLIKEGKEFHLRTFAVSCP